MQRINKSSELSDTFINNITKSHFETSTRNNDRNLKNETTPSSCFSTLMSEISIAEAGLSLFSFISEYKRGQEDCHTFHLI
jgi:hypothetical protein